MTKLILSHPSRRRWAGGLALLAALLFFPVRAAAHAPAVVSSTPAAGATVTQAPKEVVIRFSEELNAKGSGFVVTDATAKQVAAGALDLDDVDHKTLRGLLTDSSGLGAYTVKWRVVLEDGDETSGQFVFSVGNAPAPALAAKLPDSPQGSPALTGPLQISAGMVVLILAAGSMFVFRRRAR